MAADFCGVSQTCDRPNTSQKSHFTPFDTMTQNEAIKMEEKARQRGSEGTFLSPRNLIFFRRFDMMAASSYLL